MRYDKEAKARRLTRAAVSDEHGRCYVWLRDVIRILGVSRRAINWWTQKRYVDAIRLPAKKGPGYVVVYPLPQVLVRLQKLDLSRVQQDYARRTFTRAEDEFIEKHLERHGFDWVAERLGRTRRSVRRRCERIAVGVKGGGAMLTSFDVARVLGVSPNLVRYWIARRGMKCTRYAACKFVRGRLRLFTPRRVLSFLESDPAAYAKVPAAGLRRLALMQPGVAARMSRELDRRNKAQGERLRRAA